MCGCALSVRLLTLAVVLLTPHDYSGTFQGGYSARFIASKKVLKGTRRVLYQNSLERTSTLIHNGFASKEYSCVHTRQAGGHIVSSTSWTQSTADKREVNK